MLHRKRFQINTISGNNYERVLLLNTNILTYPFNIKHRMAVQRCTEMYTLHNNSLFNPY